MCSDTKVLTSKPSPRREGGEGKEITAFLYVVKIQRSQLQAQPMCANETIDVVV
jgi:hypothetical protein